MSKTAKLTPNLDGKTTKLLNLTVLQRSDPSVEEILMTAAHVTMYEFNIDASQWSRKDVEGSLFVVKRNGQPRFQFIVMNRLSTDNMVENLLGDFEYEVQVPYLLYRNAAQDVNGIWFYNAHECEEVANLFSRIINTYPKMPVKPKLSPTRREFENRETVPTQAALDDSLEPTSSATSNAPTVSDDQSFMKFFNIALNVGSTPNAGHAVISEQPYQSSSTAVPGYPQIVAPTTLPSTHIPPTLSTSNPILPILEKSESNTAMKHSNDLVAPSSFLTPTCPSPLVMPAMTSSVPTAPPLNSQRNPQQPYGTPLHQPFPPPTPLQSLAPTSVPTPSFAPIISREKVREALRLLVQDTQFIDMVYQAMVNAHHS